MNREIEIKLIEACRDNKANKTTSLGESEQRLELSRYQSETRFNDELQRIFRQMPAIVLHGSQLPVPDSFESIDTVWGSLIVSRDAEGNAHVFRNACRHRGARLVNGKGCAKRMICPYHAWSYTTDGKLSNVPGQSHCFPALDKEDNGLVELACVEKYGFIWMCPKASSSSDAEKQLDSHLGEMRSHLDWLNAEKLTAFNQTSKVWKGNWKLFAEGGLETYHFAFAHRETIAPYFYNNTAVIDALGQHFRVVMPTKELEAANVTSLHDCSHTLFFLMPNSALLVQKEHVDWIQFNPLAVDETDIIITSLIPCDADLDDQIQHSHWQKNHDITITTLNEDWALGESIQVSISDDAVPYLQYGKNEWALGHFNALLDRMLGTE